ncbi:MAG: hypothetical protein AAB512_05105 [Patescibacteria group bacterium]
MNPLFLNALVWHIFLGIAAIIIFAGLPLLLRGKKLNTGLLKVYSFIGFFGFVGSWITGGYYYSFYYGKAIKGGILAGTTPWVHEILMESKEHVFLFLPFLAFVVLVIVNFFSKELVTNAKLRMNLILLSVAIVTLGIVITLCGFAISGSVVGKH